MDLKLTGSRVLLTGGSRGIGLATALALAGAGARVVACYRRDSEASDELSRRLKEISDDHLAVRADVTRPADVDRLAGTCRDALGGLDVVINNVGVDGQAPIGELTGQEWHRVLDTNLTAVYLVTQAVLPLLSERASVINIGAAAALRGRAGAAHYTASKAALIGLTRSLAKELGSRGIRVNTIAPGVIETDEELPAPVRERIGAMTALGRLGSAADVAGTVLFLASDLARYISGATVNVDGGL